MQMGVVRTLALGCASLASVLMGCGGTEVRPPGHDPEVVAMQGALGNRFVRAGDDRVRTDVLDPTPVPPVSREAGYVPLEAKKGTLILLHGALPHLRRISLHLSSHSSTFSFVGASGKPGAVHIAWPDPGVLRGCTMQLDFSVMPG